MLPQLKVPDDSGCRLRMEAEAIETIFLASRRTWKYGREDHQEKGSRTCALDGEFSSPPSEEWRGRDRPLGLLPRAGHMIPCQSLLSASESHSCYDCHGNPPEVKENCLWELPRYHGLKHSDQFFWIHLSHGPQKQTDKETKLCIL